MIPTRITLLLAVFTILTIHATAREYHVSINGDDTDSGTREAPLRTIQHAANLARPGDVITVHEGTYRERINPPRGGLSDGQRIVFQAAPDAKVVIKGSEIIKGWEKAGNDTWRVSVPNAFFGDHNPYRTKVSGDWFNAFPKASGRVYHTGTVYLDGHWMKEAAAKDAVLAPVHGEALWFGEVDDETTTLYAQFQGIDPNQRTVEINVREAVFYPEKTGINYLTVRGFTLEHAAPNWAPPTAEQVGLIGTHWSKGWIIEDNIIRYSICTGVTLGKHGDEFDNTSANSAEGYVETIKRALKRGWSKENIGSHIVRNNHISHCEQAGIVGSMGAAFSTITGNVIHNINLRDMFGGAEMAGIKFHGAIDSLIKDNHVHHCGGHGGLWLDWMTQGTRVTGNLMHDNWKQDIFVEVNHGPFVIDNNILLSPVALLDLSAGGAYVHNLIGGKIAEIHPQKRVTPYLKPHSTEIAGFSDTPCGDNRFINNHFLNGHDLSPYDKFENMTLEGNRFSTGGVNLVREGDAIHIEFDPELFASDGSARSLVTSHALGKALIPDLPFKQPDGSDFTIDKDYFENPRDPGNPAVGPFGDSIEGAARLKIHPKTSVEKDSLK